MTSVTAATGGMTPAQASQFERDGFLVVPEFVDAATLQQLRDAYDDTLSGRVVAEGDRMLGGITRQVMLPSQAHPTFDDNAALRRALTLVEPVLGPLGEVVRVFDMLIFKPPGHPEPTPWHQDFSYTTIPFAAPGSDIPLVSIQFWVALDDADVENGCMHFAPGYQTQPLMEHEVASGDPEESSRLLALVDPENQLDLSRAVAAEIPAGGCTMHSYGTPHYTPPNRSSDRPRRAYIFTLGVRGASTEPPYVREKNAAS